MSAENTVRSCCYSLNGTSSYWSCSLNRRETNWRHFGDYKTYSITSKNASSKLIFPWWNNKQWMVRWMDGKIDGRADRETDNVGYSGYVVYWCLHWLFLCKNCEVDIFSGRNMFQTVINIAHFFPAVSLQTDFITQSRC